MKRKRWVIAAVICVLLGGYTAGICGQTNKITKKQITNISEKHNQEEIAKNVLEDTGRETYDLRYLEKVTVYYGNVRGNEDKDVVISLDLGPKNSVVAAYAPSGEVYEYVGEVGVFYSVDNIQFVLVKGLDKDVIIVQEAAKQHIGVHQNSNFLRGYLYNNESIFHDVLHTPIKTDATWKEVGEPHGMKGFNNWKKVQEDTEVKWNTAGDIARLDVVRYQNYLTAQNVGKKLPKESKFKQQSNRVVVEELYWSEPWQSFVLGEAIEKQTGEPVAVLENRNSSPYVLAGFEDDSYVIQRMDGERDILAVDKIEWTKKPKGIYR